MYISDHLASPLATQLERGTESEAMADLVVGLAKSVVEGALTKAQSAIEEDARLRQSAQRDLVFITGEFQMMQSFLNVADEERVNNIVVRTWVRQIRELAYDVEDCIEFVVHLDKKSRWWRRLIPPCMAAAAEPLDEAIAEIEQLKARVEDVSSRNARYSLISDSGSKPVVTQQPATRADVGVTAFNMLVEAADIGKGQQGDLTQLITKKEDGLQVISVWGTCGDLGVTSIIRKAYGDPEICQNFDCRAWVKLIHPFNPHQFIRSLMVQFYANSGGEQRSIMGAEVLKMMKPAPGNLKDFMQELNNKKYIIVLEDVSSIVEWDAIKMFLPDSKNGSRIIVSTQQFETASLCVGLSFQVLELKQYSVEHSVYAFLKERSQFNGDNDGETYRASTSNNEISPEHKLSYTKSLTPKGNAADEWMKNFTLVGRELKVNELYQCITSALFSPFQVMSVWGIAGVGKSALVKKLYCARIRKNLAYRYGWVDVSQLFNLRDFSRRLLLDFHSDLLQAKETEYYGNIESKNPIETCRKLLEQPCLVVIDNLKSTEEWDSIKTALVSKQSKCVIIVITTEASIAAYCADKDELVFNVKGLEADAAFELFKHEVRKKKPSSPLNDLQGDARLQELISKCGGLPKIIVAIADLLVKKTVTLMDDIGSTNEEFMHTLETNPEYDNLRGLFDWMNYYFRTCPDALKPCIFYMSLFPRDHSIRRRRLVMRWVAEGYSRDSEDKSAEQNGEKFFSKLLDLSIIQHPPHTVTTALGDTRMVLCRVNGFICEYIVSRRMEENLVFELEGCCDPTTQRTGRHLTIRENWDRDKIVFESIDYSRLRSLTVFGAWKSFFISETMKLLRVLDLEDASGVNNTDLKQMLKLLRRLKFLSLRGCRDIYQLPCSLGDLRQLQTLDIRDTSIVNLPANITKLQKLQYIRAGTSIPAAEPSTSCLSASQLFELCRRRCLVGVIVPGGFHKLTALHTLGVVNISASGGKAILKDLKDLTQLRKLGVSGINRKNINKFSSAVFGHSHLESLSVQLDNDSQGCLDGISLPLKNLQSLKLYGPVNMLPDLQIDQLSKLTKLSLEISILAEEHIRLFGDLPKLVILRICVDLHQDGELNLCFSNYSCGLEVSSYKKVKVLQIACCSRMHVIFGAKTMKKLELLKADLGNRSQVRFSGLKNLTELKEACFKDSCDEALNQDLRSQLDSHPKKPILKLETTRSSS